MQSPLVVLCALALCSQARLDRPQSPVTNPIDKPTSRSRLDPISLQIDPVVGAVQDEFTHFVSGVNRIFNLSPQAIDLDLDSPAALPESATVPTTQSHHFKHAERKAACVGRPFLWSSEYGTCPDYLKHPLRNFCDYDEDKSNSLLAVDVCAECGRCRGLNVSRPLFESAMGRITNSPTNTIKIILEDSVTRFTPADVVLDAGTTEARLGTITMKHDYSQRTNSQALIVEVPIRQSTRVGKYTVGIRHNTAAVDANGQTIGVMQNFTTEVAFCRTHEDCGTGLYCFGCVNCLASFDASFCGNCDVSVAGTGSCGQVANCASDGDSIDGQCPEDDPCSCTTSGVSNGVQTKLIGCDAWEPPLGPICYVAGDCPIAINSPRFSNAKIRACTPSDAPDSKFECINNGLERVGSGAWFECANGTVLLREAENCSATSVPIRACVCPEDFFGVNCQSQRTFKCSIKGVSTCTEETAGTGTMDYHDYDWKIPGDPICLIASCSDKVNIGASVACSLARFNQQGFLARTGVTEADLQSAVNEFESLYLINGVDADGNPFRVSTDPRIIIGATVIDQNEIFVDVLRSTQGIPAAFLNTDSSSLLEVNLGEIDRSHVVSGRVYVEVGLEANEGRITAEASSMFIDCEEILIGTRDKSLSRKELGRIIFLVAICVCAVLFAIHRYRLSRDRKRKLE